MDEYPQTLAEFEERLATCRGYWSKVDSPLPPNEEDCIRSRADREGTNCDGGMARGRVRLCREVLRIQSVERSRERFYGDCFGGLRRTEVVDGQGRSGSGGVGAGGLVVALVSRLREMELGRGWAVAGPGRG